MKVDIDSLALEITNKVLRLCDEREPSKPYFQFIAQVQCDVTRILESAIKPIPEGWKVVPLEPTDRMRKIADDPWGRYDADYIIREYWRPMVKAAPDFRKGIQNENSSFK